MEAEVRRGRRGAGWPGGGEARVGATLRVVGTLEHRGGEQRGLLEQDVLRNEGGEP